MDRATVYAELEALYADLQKELDALRPRCELSGRCCRFKEYGHQLWTTPLEIEYLIDREGLPGRKAADGVCPYLREGRCGVRDHRMLGCRIYFCDPAYQSAMNPLYEKYHARIKDLHRRSETPHAFFEFLGEINRRARP